MSKIQWAVHDKDKFGAMVTDLKDLIDQLRDLTASVADLERQRRTFIEEVSSVSDVSTLELLEEALKEDDEEASDIASQRILQLTNGSVCETMDRMTLESDSTYVTAPSQPACEAGIQDNLSTDAVEGDLWDRETDHLHTDIVDGYQNNLMTIQFTDKEDFRKQDFGLGRLGRSASLRLISELKDFMTTEGKGFTSIRVMKNVVSESCR